MRKLRYLELILLFFSLYACGAGGGGTDTSLDTTPDSFSFTPHLNAELDAVVDSTAVVINGINAAAPIIINNGMYSIDGGLFTTTDGQINNGQTLKVRATASPKYATQTRSIVTVGGLNVSFTVITHSHEGQAIDSLPGDPVILSQSYASIDTATGFVYVTTNEDTHAWVEYGRDARRPYTSAVSPFSKSHGIALPWLTPNAVYNYLIKVEDADGNITTHNSIWRPGTPDGSVVITTDPNNVFNSINPRSQNNCAFDVGSINANDIIALNCLLDLDKKNFNLPANVTLSNAGGDVINGTLIFNGGTIDGELLNSSVYISGNVQLITPTFIFEKERWNIKEGTVSNEESRNNTIALQYALDLTSTLGANKFNIDDLDAYFWTGSYNRAISGALTGIVLPSNFHLMMTNRTVLRTQANGFRRYSLLGMSIANNITIEGGTLIGERDTHDYNDPQSPDPYWGHLLQIKASKNITILNVTAKNATGDGLSISSIGTYNKADHIETENILVNGCTFDNNRRLGVAITAGKGIIVENSTLLNSGQHTAHSQGILPSYAIDVEGFRVFDSNGNRVYHERPYNITIRNNTERNSRKGAFIAAISDHVVMAGNNTEKVIAIGSSHDSQIINNTITKNPAFNSTFGISTGYNGEATFYPGDTSSIGNNVVSGNTLNGLGIYVAGRTTHIFNNVINDSKLSFYFQRAKDIEIYDNTAISRVSSANGVAARDNVNNVNFYRNNIDVTNLPIRFEAVNNEPDESGFNIMINNNDFNSTGAFKALIFSKAHNVTLDNNRVTNSGEQISDSNNLTFTNNQIQTADRPGFLIDSGNSNLNISNNTVTYPANNQCISNAGGTNIVIGINTCNPL